MDYSKLSDMEINGRVLHVITNGKAIRLQQASVASGETDYCNKAADACTIIFASRIALIPDASEHGAHQWWDAQSSCQTHGIHYQANPLRAAMIVFLMMQGDE